jgi:hypothetical protein
VNTYEVIQVNNCHKQIRIEQIQEVNSFWNRNSRNFMYIIFNKTTLQ